jgi:hypothetical protein
MSKFSGTSITPGQQTLIETPVEKLSEFSSIPFNDNIGEPITMEESVNLSPPLEGEVTSGLNTTDTITDDVNIEDLSTDFNVGETPVVEKTSEELLTGAFEDPVQRAKERVPALTELLGITSLTTTNQLELQWLED